MRLGLCWPCLILPSPLRLIGRVSWPVCRPRWRIELAFKRLKSLIRVDRPPAHTPEGSLAWLYPHLILALLTEDVCQEILAFPPFGGG